MSSIIADCRFCGVVDACYEVRDEENDVVVICDDCRAEATCCGCGVVVYTPFYDEDGDHVCGDCYLVYVEVEDD